ncbi:Opr family porin [Malaciobacter mytili]|uniref:Opr family porin n=1 Tax=Malaciobacter mytili TaxID=603050 RepID=UPI003BAFF3F2
MKKISLYTCALLLSASTLVAADSIDEAFKNGKVSGDITLYTIKTDNKDGVKNSGFTAGTIGLGYETDSYKGFSAKMAFRGNHEFSEVEEDDYENSFVNDAIITEANIKYANKDFSLTLGRQVIDLEWLEDYNEAVVAAITAIPDTTIVAGYTHRQATSDEDESSDFTELTKKGAYVLDVKYNGIKDVEFNPYFYSAPDAVDFYGLKASYSSDIFSAIAHYASSNVDNKAKNDTTDDGNILNLEVGTTIAGISASIGYIKTDSKYGIGLMDTYGDNINLMDSGNQLYSADAKTFYGTLGYEVAGVELGALYSATEYSSSNYDENELNLTVGYKITDSLSVGVLYVNIDADDKDSDTNDNEYASLTLSYSF